MRGRALKAYGAPGTEVVYQIAGGTLPVNTECGSPAT
jgi:hypothetical protein